MTNTGKRMSVGGEARGGSLPVRRRVLQVGLALAAGAVLLPAMASDAVVEIEIRDYKFFPESVTVKAGTTVKWINREKRTSHSILFLGADGFESERMFPDESWQRKFTVPGEYVYSCGPHREMSGRLIVE